MRCSPTSQVLKRCQDLLEMLQEEETQKLADRVDESTKAGLPHLPRTLFL